jgi:hypothetical protein
MQSDMDISVPASCGKRQRQVAASTSPDGTRGKKQKVEKKEKEKEKKKKTQQEKKKKKKQEKEKEKKQVEKMDPRVWHCKESLNIAQVVYMPQRPSMTRLFGCLQ